MYLDSTVNRRYTIAVDAMGGDDAPATIIAGLDLAYGELVANQIDLLLFGKAEMLAPYLLKYPRLNSISKVIQAGEVVSPEDKPSKVIRSGRKTSMWMAIESVRNKEADAIISAGNTGCLMGISRLLLSMLEGVRRPAITTQIPNEKGGFTVMLDLGANTECDEHDILQFGIMGSVYAQIISGIARPRVGILNIGSEVGKGFEYLNKAAELNAVHRANLLYDYRGFVEGDDIFKCKVDVIATDGFSGNVALKTLEGTAKFITGELKRVFKDSIIAKFGYLLMYNSLRYFRKKMDPRRYNGAVLLGLNGIVVKSHGGADALGFSSAVKYATKLVAGDFDTRVKMEMDKVEN